MTDQQREALSRMAREMPADERTALLAALEAAVPNAAGQIDLLAVTRDALDHLGLTAVDAEQAIGAACADPPDWRKALS